MVTQTKPLAATSSAGETHAAATWPGQRASDIRLCPNVILAGVCLIAITYVAYFNALSVLVFLTAGTALILRRPQQALLETRRFLWVYLPVGWCLLSVLWSAYPGLSLRAGIQLGLTVAIAIALATRLSPQNFLKVVFVALSVAVVGSLLFGRVRMDGVWFGVFGSKNAFAQTMSIYLIAATALIRDARLTWRWRMAGGLGAAVGTPMLLLADSIGALITTATAILLLLALSQVHRVSAARLLVAAITVGLTVVLIALLALVYQNELTRLFLQTTGKDVTLTGRTELWQAALHELARNPLIGQGYRAFWVHGNPVAEEMWAIFDIEARAGFHFHNTFLSNAVEIGVIGAALQLLIFVPAVWLTLVWAVRAHDAASLVLAAFMLRQLILCMVEVVVYAQFDLASILSLCALIFGVRARTAMQDTNRRRALRDSIPRQT